MNSSHQNRLHRAFQARKRPAQLFRSDLSCLTAEDAHDYEQKLTDRSMEIDQMLDSALQPFMFLSDDGKAYLLPHLLSSVERSSTILISIATYIKTGHFSFLSGLSSGEKEAVAAYVGTLRHRAEHGIPLTEWYEDEITAIEKVTARA